MRDTLSLASLYTAYQRVRRPTEAALGVRYTPASASASRAAMLVCTPTPSACSRWRTMLGGTSGDTKAQVTWWGRLCSRAATSSVAQLRERR